MWIISNWICCANPFKFSFNSGACGPTTRKQVDNNITSQGPASRDICLQIYYIYHLRSWAPRTFTSVILVNNYHIRWPFHVDSLVIFSTISGPFSLEIYYNYPPWGPSRTGLLLLNYQPRWTLSIDIYNQIDNQISNPGGPSDPNDGPYLPRGSATKWHSNRFYVPECMKSKILQWRPIFVRETCLIVDSFFLSASAFCFLFLSRFGAPCWGAGPQIKGY